jgi:hypothetical protein
VDVSFESGSALTRIGPLAFVLCCSLRSIALPARLETIACGAFRNCGAVCELIFEIPSRLKELDLPPGEFGSLCIPDSVEVVYGGIGKIEGQRRLLQFGRESRVMQIELRGPVDIWAVCPYEQVESNAFVDLSKEVLRRFRCPLENFGESVDFW